MDTADHLRDANPWKAEKDPKKLAILGKLAEELGELQAVVCRCIIQGADEVHPVTGKPNLEWLWEEMVDVANMMDFVYRTWEADWDAIIRRRAKKHKMIEQWLASFDEPLVKAVEWPNCGCRGQCRDC